MSLLTEAYDRYSEHTALDGEGIELAMEFELRAMECGADPEWDRERIVRFERARKGGLATLTRYGKPYYRALALARWGKPSKDERLDSKTDPDPDPEQQPENADERMTA